MADAVRFEGVTKRYLRGGARYRSLRHDIVERVRRAGRRLRGRPVQPRGTLALEDVSFSMPEGESLALVGPNGSGKTTALKLMTRISYPSAGRVLVRGRVAALIEIGGGIHPELTGRENIGLYGRILGMSKADVAKRFDEIVEFAEIGHALDRQVKMFSSGMQLRLGFSIASHLNPEVFLVDEALAVGDADFQQKCVDRMGKLVGEGRSLIFVSHDLSAVQSTCDRGIFLLDGRVRAEGPVEQVISAYLRWVDEAHQARDADRLLDGGVGGRVILGATCHRADGEESYVFRTGDDVELRLALARGAASGSTLSVALREPGTRRSLLFRDATTVPADSAADEVVCLLRRVPLLPGIYEIWGSVRGDGGPSDKFRALGTLRIAEGPEGAGRSARAPLHIETTWRHAAP